MGKIFLLDVLEAPRGKTGFCCRIFTTGLTSVIECSYFIVFLAESFLSLCQVFELVHVHSDRVACTLNVTQLAVDLLAQVELYTLDLDHFGTQ